MMMMMMIVRSDTRYDWYGWYDCFFHATTMTNVVRQHFEGFYFKFSSCQYNSVIALFHFNAVKAFYSNAVIASFYFNAVIAFFPSMMKLVKGT